MSGEPRHDYEAEARRLLVVHDHRVSFRSATSTPDTRCIEAAITLPSGTIVASCVGKDVAETDARSALALEVASVLQMADDLRNEISTPS